MDNKISTHDFLALSYEEIIGLMINEPERIDLPEEAAYVAQYLQQYRPVVPPVAHLDNETSVDIQETMQSICIIDTKIVSRIMKMLGYKLHIQGISQPEWSMRHIESK